VIAGVSLAFGVFQKRRVHASAAGWPEVHVMLNREDSEGVVLIWSGKRAVTNDKKHLLDALVKVTVRGYLSLLSLEKPPATSRLSALVFLGWGGRDRNTPAGAAVSHRVGAGEAAYGKAVCATSSSVLATSSTT